MKTTAFKIFASCVAIVCLASSAVTKAAPALKSVLNTSENPIIPIVQKLGIKDNHLVGLNFVDLKPHHSRLIANEVVQKPAMVVYDPIVSKQLHRQRRTYNSEEENRLEKELEGESSSVSADSKEAVPVIPDVSNETQGSRQSNEVQNSQSNEVQDSQQSNEVQNSQQSNEVQNSQQSNEVQNSQQSNEVQNSQQSNEVQNSQQSNEVQNSQQSNEVQNSQQSNEVKNSQQSNEVQNSQSDEVQNSQSDEVQNSKSDEVQNSKSDEANSSLSDEDYLGSDDVYKFKELPDHFNSNNSLELEETHEIEEEFNESNNNDKEESDTPKPTS